MYHKEGRILQDVILPPKVNLGFVSRSTCAGYILEMRDISVDESEELPQILHSLVNDSPAAVAGRGTDAGSSSNPRSTPMSHSTAEGEGEEAAGGMDGGLLTEAIRMGAPALMQLQVRSGGYL